MGNHNEFPSRGAAPGVVAFPERITTTLGLRTGQLLTDVEHDGNPSPGAPFAAKQVEVYLLPQGTQVG